MRYSEFCILQYQAAATKKNKNTQLSLKPEQYSWSKITTPKQTFAAMQRLYTLEDIDNIHVQPSL